MQKVIIQVNGRNLTAFESKRPKGYKLSSGIIGGDNDARLNDLIAAVVSAGYEVIKSEMQSSSWGPVPTVYFR